MTDWANFSNDDYALYDGSKHLRSYETPKGPSIEQLKDEELFRDGCGVVVFVVFAFVALAVLLWAARVVIG